MGPAPSVLKTSVKVIQMKIRDNDLEDIAQGVAPKNFGVTYSKKFVKRTKDKKEVLIINASTYSYIVITRKATKPKFTKIEATGVAVYSGVQFSDGMVGISFRGKGHKHHKDDTGENQKWYQTEVPTNHVEFIGTKYLDVKFNEDEENANDEFDDY